MQPEVSIKERPVRRVTALVALGSNLGDRLACITSALGRINQHPGCRVLTVSSLYRTEPVGAAGGEFLNGAAAIETSLTPSAFLDFLKSIEAALGRTGSSCDARPIDLDIIFFGDDVVDQPGLTIPHPRWSEREFVLVPLLEVCGAQVDPQSGSIVADIARQRISDGTSALLSTGPGWFAK